MEHRQIIRPLDFERNLPLAEYFRQRLHPLFQRRTVNLPGIQRRQPPANPLQKSPPNFGVLNLPNLLPQRDRQVSEIRSRPPTAFLGQSVTMHGPPATDSLRPPLDIAL